MNNKPCGLCHTGFKPMDTLCNSPIYGDSTGVFHTSCMIRIGEIMTQEGTNDISHIVYPSNDDSPHTRTGMVYCCNLCGEVGRTTQQATDHHLQCHRYNKPSFELVRLH